MEHKLVGSTKGKMGIGCSCGKRFPVEAAAEKHVKEENQKLNEAKVAEAFKPDEAPAQYRQDKQKVVDKQSGEITGGPVSDNEPEAAAEPTPPAPKKSEVKAAPAPAQTGQIMQRPAVVGPAAVSAYLNNDEVKKIIQSRIAAKPEPFIAAIMTAVNGNDALARCTPKSILGAAIEATGLNLSVAPALGEAYLVPYKNHGVDEAQLQIGYKGLIQLAQRSGQYKTIAATAVYDGQLAEENPLSGNTYDWKAKKSDKVIGYVAYFKLLNGFEASWYMTAEQVRKHAQRFSQSFRKGFGPWKDHEERMSLKTPMRFLLSTYGPRSIEATELQRALEVDQAVIEGDTIEYPDNRPEYVDRIEAASSRDELKQIMADLPAADKKEAAPMIEAKMRELA